MGLHLYAPCPGTRLFLTTRGIGLTVSIFETQEIHTKATHKCLRHDNGDGELQYLDREFYFKRRVGRGGEAVASLRALQGQPVVDAKLLSEKKRWWIALP